MSTFPGLQAAIAGVIGKHYPGDPALPDAIARAVVEFATTEDATKRGTVAAFDASEHGADGTDAAIRAALGEENADA